MSTVKIKRVQQVKLEQMQQLIQYQQQLLQQNNIVPYQQGTHQQFEAACKKFRDVCDKISTLLGEPFNGSYDDIQKYKDTDAMRSYEGQQLKQDLNLYNQLCIHEGNKIGLPPPQWFFKCWNIEGAQ